MDHFVRGYLVCALWTGTDESDESGGSPLDSNYDLDDIDPASVKRAEADCSAFEDANAADLAIFHEHYPVSPDGDHWRALAGHNLWLTRNHHGTGFWDRGYGTSDEMLVALGSLTAASEAMGEVNAFLDSDSGTIYIE